MGKVRWVLLALVVVASCGAHAQAQSDPRPGTYLLAEAELGYGYGGAFAEGPEGFASGVAFGVGGKPKGWPLRLFGIVRLGWGGLSGRIDNAFSRAIIDRDVLSWGVGLRVIAPIVNRLRLIADTTLGSMAVDSVATIGGGAEQIASSDESFLVEIGVGLQYRLHYHFSIGLRMDVAMPTGLDSFDALAEAAGARSGEAGSANLDWTLAVTLHF